MPIRELSRRIGVSTDLLRKWEHRHAVFSPERTSGNQRLYSQIDEARERLMLRHVRSGMSSAQAAELAAAARFRIKADPAVRSPAATDSTTNTRMTMQTALEHYDETTAEQALEKLLTMLPATAVIRDVLLPYLRDIGERWADAHLTVAQEHFASNFIHSRLLGIARGWDRGLGPRAVLACPPDEQHTFGLIAFGIALHQIGWRIISRRRYPHPDDRPSQHHHSPTPDRHRRRPAQPIRKGPARTQRPGRPPDAGNRRRRSHPATRQPLRSGAHLTDDPITAADTFLP